ncbi:hypothetical protein T02_5109 [Trichinella nativa]|uniref:Uncharacterized protein n=1 Tax=Trichinella nativa TaxID=6335 RepID=A0A0V1L7Z6_9BILA|nr:hypothetical protein T02_9048 [Trichinella nativa]KRZ55668.1 hypothetical protein T02_6588 [Trichinella nativa]KRZ58951.1 hypothetical protein T02_5109 [Trichinella nativa]
MEICTKLYSYLFILANSRFGTTRSHFSLIGLCPRYFIGPSNLCCIGFHFIGPSSLCRIGFPCLIAH